MQKQKQKNVFNIYPASLLVSLFSGSTIDSRDIVDGHREKTLSLLWKIIFAFQVRIPPCVVTGSHNILVIY